MNIVEALTFDDVLLIPQESDILPQDVSLKTKLTRNIEINIPLITSPMDTITESNMAIAMANLGGIGIIHKNLSAELQALEVSKVKQSAVKDKNLASLDKKNRLLVGAAIGVSADKYERIEKLLEAEIDVLVIDTAHGHSKNVIESIKEIKKRYPHIEIIAGNIATADGAKALIDCGVDAIKIGIGSGSICTTRIVCGIGVPQLTAISDASKIAKQNGIISIADGGVKSSGDIVKALAIGADCVMAGGLYAGTEEAPGETIDYDGKKQKLYRGMGSIAAMELGSKDRYFQGGITNSSKFVPEGIEGVSPYKGSVESIVYQLVGGIRSGLGYTGSINIAELQKRAKFVRITNQGLIESHVHDVTILKEAPNYRKQ